MRWSCPHCGINLGITDDKISTSWAFSRCYQCGGYALIRRSEINIIKVDRAPAGEKVLLPESSENPLLSENATRKLERYRSSSPVSRVTPDAYDAAPISNFPSPDPALNAISERPVVKPATRRSTFSGVFGSRAARQAPNPTGVQEEFHPASHEQSVGMFSSEGALDAPVPIQQPYASSSSSAATKPLAGPHAPAGASVDRSIPPASAYAQSLNAGLPFPEPLPDVPPPGNRIRFLPMAVGICGALAIGSGFFLFVQGQAISSPRATSARSISDRPVRSRSYMDSDSEPADGPVTQGRQTRAQVAPPMNRQPISRAAKSAPLVKSAKIAVSRLYPRSMLPHPIVKQPAVNQPLVTQPTTTRLAQNESYSDQVRSQAMAPVRTQPDLEPVAPEPVRLSSENPPLIVQPRIKDSHLRSGPGVAYPVIGKADLSKRYVVTDWNDRWFKVLPQLPSTSPRGDQELDERNEIAGWIRTDSVKVVQSASVSD